MWVNAHKFNGFCKFRKRVKKIFKSRNHIIKKKKKEVIHVQYVFLLYYSLYYIFTGILFGDYNAF